MVIITTTPILEGMPIKEYRGIINTNIVIGTNLFSDFAASFTDVFGGNPTRTR
ncbi:MAG: heavy metal-binding domain-containing protein [Bacteroidaceae bacterium]|nr:heavy metal-binding domain-containing protein [Bacteroidaceae bacterium]